MSTNAVIIVAMHEKKGKKLTFKKSLVHAPLVIESYDNNGGYNQRKINIKFPTTTINDNYGVIWHHWDGYPSGVGQVLLEHYNSVEKARNLIAMGNVSTIVGGETDYIRPYFNNNLENSMEVWENEKPIFAHTINEAENAIYSANFYYLFMDDKWWVKGWDEKTFIPLEEHKEINEN